MLTCTGATGWVASIVAVSFGGVLTTLAWVVLALIAAFYLLGPLVIRATPTIRIHLDLVPIDPTQLPPEIAPAHAAAAADLAELGFACRGLFSAHGNVPGVGSYVSLWVNDRTGDMSQLIFAMPRVADSSGPAKVNTVVEFNTVFPDGTAVVTDNAQVTCFKPVAFLDRVRWPAVVSPPLLYTLHRDRVGRAAAGRPPVLPDADAATYLRRETVVILEHQVRAGYLWFDHARGVARPTLRGAYGMTWRILPPGRQIVLALSTHKLRAALAAAGMSHLLDPGPAALTGTGFDVLRQ